MSKEIDLDVIRDFMVINSFVSHYGKSAMTKEQKDLVKRLALSLLPKVKEAYPDYKFHRDKDKYCKECGAKLVKDERFLDFVCPNCDLYDKQEILKKKESKEN